MRQSMPSLVSLGFGSRWALVAAALLLGACASAEPPQVAQSEPCGRVDGAIAFAGLGFSALDDLWYACRDRPGIVTCNPVVAPMAVAWSVLWMPMGLTLGAMSEDVERHHCAGRAATESYSNAS